MSTTACSVLLGSVPRGVAAEPEPAAVAQPDADPQELSLEQLYAEGERKFASGDLHGAARAFGDGLARVGEDQPRLRAYFSVSLGAAHLELYEQGAMAVDLRRAHQLLAGTVERDAEVLAAEPRLEALARRHRDRADELLRELDEPAPSPEAKDPQVPNKVVATTPVEPSDPPDPRRRRAGIGLLVAGTASFVGGLALVIDGATLEQRAKDIAGPNPALNQQKYIEEDVPRLRNIRYGIGIPLALIGGGMVIAGAILLGRSGKPRRVTLAPGAAPSRAGLVLSGSF